MARLTRKNIKVFAENATNNGVFGSLQAENPVTTNNVEQIQSLPAWGNGWNSATVTSDMLPPLEEFQGVQYVTTYQQAYIMQEGLPEWGASVTYYKGSLVKEVTANGFKIYNSLTDDNTNNLLSDTSNWVKVMDSTDLYAFDNEVVHIAGDETITGNKLFKGLLQKELTTANDWQEVLGIYDNSHTERGFISYIGNDVDGKQVVLISSMKEFNGTPKYATLYMIIDANGNTYVEAPASDINKSIVTTVNKNKAQNGYFKLGNGLIIQWGTVTAQNQVLTITLPTAFSNTNYIVSGSTMDLGKALFLRGKTTTTFRLDLDGGIGTATISWMAIGY